MRVEAPGARKRNVSVQPRTMTLRAAGPPLPSPCDTPPGGGARARVIATVRYGQPIRGSSPGARLRRHTGICPREVSSAASAQQRGPSLQPRAGGPCRRCAIEPLFAAGLTCSAGCLSRRDARWSNEVPSPPEHGPRQSADARQGSRSPPRDNRRGSAPARSQERRVHLDRVAAEHVAPSGGAACPPPGGLTAASSGAVLPRHATNSVAVVRRSRSNAGQRGVAVRSMTLRIASASQGSVHQAAAVASAPTHRQLKLVELCPEECDRGRTCCTSAVRRGSRRLAGRRYRLSPKPSAERARCSPGRPSSMPAFAVLVDRYA